MQAMRAALVALVWLVGAAVAAPADEAPTDPALARERVALQSVASTAQNGTADVKVLAAELHDIISDPAFSRLSDAERHQAFSIYGACLFDSKQFADAREPIRTASAMAQAGESDWNLRLDDSYILGDFADAAHAAAMIARNWPDKLKDYKDEAIYRLRREVQKPGVDPKLAEEFLSAMFDAHWKPKDAFDLPDSLWLDLLRIRLDHGDLAAANSIAAQIKDPETLIEIHADRRFDAIVQAAPAQFDVMNAYAQELARLKAAADAAPDKLEGFIAEASLLRKLGRAREGLALIDAAFGKLKTGEAAFSDANAKRIWLYNERAKLLFQLGMQDDGLAALAEGASLQEDGSPNVSQAINLADAYNDVGRPRDALSAIAGLNASLLSAYGHLARENAQVCAYYVLGEDKNLARALDDMKAHKDNGLGTLIDALLCTGDTSAVAQQLIGQLKDPENRLAWLYMVQNYAADPHPTKRQRQRHALWLSVLARPDVAAEIARVGRMETYPVESPSY